MKANAIVSHLETIEEQGLTPDNAQALLLYLGELQAQNQEQPNSAFNLLIKMIADLSSPLIQTSPPTLSEEQLMMLLHALKQLQEMILNQYIAPTTKDEWVPSRYTIMIALKDKVLEEELAQQIKYFNYECISFKRIEDVVERTQHQDSSRYSAVILDLELCNAEDLELLKKLSVQVPIIFTAHEDNVAKRLFSVKAGGRAFFPQPLEFASLIEKIDFMLHPESETPPYRILIIEDSRTQANIIKKNLEQAGMLVEILVDPFKINESLQEFQPDLILMDLYMPQCTGLELAKVIRQQDLFVSIPIVFLSAEDNTDKQLMAMTVGGDDFLTKPISPNHLVASVQARCIRSRTLRAEMIQDSLTGLLNHTRILEQLELEIARSKRTQTTLAFAMIDIDHFKLINDNHGHPVGDRVIKGLARLLKQRLRRIDSVGRYGGEEFAVIFPQTSAEDISKKLEELRRAFSKLLHRSADPLIEFTATFSVGLAELSDTNDTVDKIVQAADKALYSAKEQGRNCLVMAPNSE